MTDVEDDCDDLPSLEEVPDVTKMSGDSASMQRCIRPYPETPSSFRDYVFQELARQLSRWIDEEYILFETPHVIESPPAD